MASKVISCSLLASPLLSNKASLSSSKITLGPQTITFRGSTLSKTTPLRLSSLVVRAQPDEGGISKEISHLDPRVSTIDTSPYMRTPWNMKEDDNEIKMWFDMRLDVNVVDNLLIIKGTESTDAFGRKIQSPFDCKLQLPINCIKEETRGGLENGVLYISVPKIARAEHTKVIHVPLKGI